MVISISVTHGSATGQIIIDTGVQIPTVKMVQTAGDKSDMVELGEVVYNWGNELPTVIGSAVK